MLGVGGAAAVAEKRDGVTVPHGREAGIDEAPEGLFQSVARGRQDGPVLIQLGGKKGLDVHRLFPFAVARPS